MPRPQRRLQTEACQNAGVVRVNKADAPTAIGPEAYASWRATPLGAITEGIEQCLILDLMGDLAGRRVLDAGCGDGALICAAASRGAAATGIDPDPAMLAAARAGGRGGLWCKVCAGSARTAALPRGQFRFGCSDYGPLLCARCRRRGSRDGARASTRWASRARGTRALELVGSDPSRARLARLINLGGSEVPNRGRAQVPGPAGRTFYHGNSRPRVLPTGWHACPRPATSRFRARPADNVRCGVHRGERRTGRWSLGERMLVTVGPRVSTIRLPRA